MVMEGVEVMRKRKIKYLSVVGTALQDAAAKMAPSDGAV